LVLASGKILLGDLGQFVVTPAAVMAAELNRPLPKLVVQANPLLYVEFRKDGIPVDPGPWWAANEGQKVRG
jgi:septal ring factor EnvC (AmiA/AmiB activator)